MQFYALGKSFDNHDMQKLVLKSWNIDNDWINRVQINQVE